MATVPDLLCEQMSCLDLDPKSGLASENDSPQRIVTPVKIKCCRSCLGLREKLDEMTLEIEILKSQTDSLQAYVNSNGPNSSLVNFTALIKNLELQLASTNDRIGINGFKTSWKP